MKIIAEGPDGSGKSTLLAELSKRFNILVWHAGGPAKSREGYLQKIKETEDQLGKVLIDRAPHISERVYSALKSGLPINDAEYTDVLSKLQREEPIIIYCRLDNPEDMISSMQSGKAYKPQDHIDTLKEGYLEIVKGYDSIMDLLEFMNFRVIRYNWQKDNIEDVIKTIWLLQVPNSQQ